MPQWHHFRALLIPLHNTAMWADTTFHGNWQQRRAKWYHFLTDMMSNCKSAIFPPGSIAKLQFCRFPAIFSFPTVYSYRTGNREHQKTQRPENFCTAAEEICFIPFPHHSFLERAVCSLSGAVQNNKPIIPNCGHSLYPMKTPTKPWSPMDAQWADHRAFSFYSTERSGLVKKSAVGKHPKSGTGWNLKRNEA